MNTFLVPLSGAIEMTISRLTKGLLNVYLAALLGAALAAGLGNSISKAVYRSAGGSATSHSSDGTPDFTLAEAGLGATTDLPDRDLGYPIK